ncbi:MAG: hypothetical protein IJM97_06065 [Clostridia bacterium]|nr:hypothetical protein [Clostridia bacterium]
MNRFLTSFFFTLLLVFSIITLSSEYKTAEKSVKNVSESYSLMDYNGKLAVFKNNSDMPVRIFNVYLDNLPESDKADLKKGITCKDDAELKRLIEDYTS